MMLVFQIYCWVQENSLNLSKKKCNPKTILNALESINSEHLNSLSDELRSLLVGSDEIEYIKAILEL